MSLLQGYQSLQKARVRSIAKINFHLIYFDEISIHARAVSICSYIIIVYDIVQLKTPSLLVICHNHCFYIATVSRIA